jgi:hypothetical protein
VENLFPLNPISICIPIQLVSTGIDNGGDPSHYYHSIKFEMMEDDEAEADWGDSHSFPLSLADDLDSSWGSQPAFLAAANRTMKSQH